MQSVKRLIPLVPQLQFVAALALVLADNFACPSLRDRQIVHEQVAAVLLCYDDRADDVLIRFLKSDFLYRITVTFRKVAEKVLFGRKTAP